MAASISIPGRGARLVALASLGLWLTGCVVAPLGHLEPPRAAAPLPADKARPFTYAGATEPVSLELREESSAVRHFEGLLRAPDVEPGAPRDIRYELFLSRAAAGRRPLVVVVPILGGGYGIERLIARAAADAGWHALFVHREDDLLAPANDSRDLETVLRRSVVAIRRTLDVVLARDDMDATRVGLVGVSLGAIFGTLVSAVEPRVGPKVLVMGGGDLPEIVATSWEQPVRRYRVARMDVLGISDPTALANSLRQGFRLDPLDYAPHVDPRSVFQVLTLYDNRVPTKNQRKLWSALGKPRGIEVPSGHYTLAIYKDEALGAMQAHFAAAFAERRDVATPPRSAAR